MLLIGINLKILSLQVQEGKYIAQARAEIKKLQNVTAVGSDMSSTVI